MVIVETGSFSKAAERLHIAQPALSQHVMTMEAALGVSLLHRVPRGVLPTDAGLRLLERARAINSQFSALSDYVRGIASIPSGEVHFGMPATINEMLGVPLIETALHQYSNVRIRISEAMSGFVLNWLRDGLVDLAMLYNVNDEKGLTLHRMLTEEIHLFGLPSMKSAPEGDCVTLAKALRLPLILPGPAHGLRNLIDTAARSIGKHTNPMIEIDSYRQIKQLAARGLGFGMLPTTAIKQQGDNIKFSSWRVSRPSLMRQIHLGYPKDKPLSTASRAVGQLGWSILKSLVEQGHWAAIWNDAADLNLYP